MRFAEAWSLLWFLPVATAILLLYLLRLRRRRQEVASIMLWSQVLQDLQANAPWQRLRRHWLLLVQLLAALLLVLAVAQPYTRVWSYSGQAHVIVLDGSASMLATDVSPNRFQRARALVQEYLQAMPSRDQAAIILAGARPRVLCGLTSSRSELTHALREAQPAETGVNIAEALSLASAMLAPFGAATIEVFTDGGFAEPRDVQLGRAVVHYHLVGRAAPNAGIVAIDLREDRNRRGNYNLFVVVRHNQPRLQRYAVELWREGQLVDVQEVEVAPRSEGSLLFQQISASDRPEGLRVRLDTQDALPTDDNAYAVLPPIRPLRVLLVTKGNLFLETALRLYPHAEVYKSPEPSTQNESFEVVVYDRIPPPSPPTGNAILIGTIPQWFPVIPLSPVRDTIVVDWQTSHPVMRYVDLSAVRISRAQPLLPKEGVESLVEIAEGAVVVGKRQGGHRWLLISFDVIDSDLPLRIAFPVMMLNALQWIASAGTQEQAASVPAGSVVSIPVPAGLSRINLRLPDGRKAVLPVQGEAVLYEQTTRLGFYRGEENGYLFAVNLLQREETDLPRHELSTTSNVGSAQNLQKVRVRREWWHWLATALLGVLVLEWVIYHRRW